MAKCILQLYRTRICTTSTKNVRCRRVEILTPPICYETRDAKIKTKFVCSHAFYYDLRVNKLHTYYTRARVAPSFRRPSICSYIIIKQIRRDINLDDVKIPRSTFARPVQKSNSYSSVVLRRHVRVNTEYNASRPHTNRKKKKIRLEIIFCFIFKRRYSSESLSSPT